MPVFSKESRQALSTCHPDLQLLMREVIRVYDIKVLEGHRPKGRQDKLVMDGKSQTPWPHSNHNSEPSRAVDVVPYPIDWDNRARFHYMGGLILGIAHMLYKEGKISHRVRWGGDWNQNDDPSDESFYDGPHFELLDG